MPCSKGLTFKLTEDLKMSFKLYSVPDFKMTDSLWATIDQNKINLLASNNKLIKDNERFLTMGLSRKPDIYSCV